MLRQILIFLAIATSLLAGLAHGCKKDTPPPPPAPTHIGTEISFTEEFDSVYNLQTKGWVMTDNSSASGNTASAPWSQGLRSVDKSGNWYGFVAYSYQNLETEFIYSNASSSASQANYSSWLISPVLSVKNGDKISFYTRGDTTGTNYNRMQVRVGMTSGTDVGHSASSVGSFSEMIMEINPSQSAGGYPQIWTKYEYTFTGITSKTDVRVGFRHYISNIGITKGIGIDQFKFQAN